MVMKLSDLFTHLIGVCCLINMTTHDDFTTSGRV